MDHWIVKLATDLKTLFLCFVALIILFHILFVYPKNIGKIGWKIIEYIVLLIASIGIITISADIRTWLAKSHLRWEEMRAVSDFENIVYKIREGHPGYICCIFTRSEYSPNNFEEINEEYDRACKWYKKMSELLPQKIDPEFKELIFSEMPKLNVKDEIINESINEVKNSFQRYMAQREIMMNLREKTKKNDFEDLLLIFSPFLLCVALALQITKITGGIRSKT